METPCREIPGGALVVMGRRAGQRCRVGYSLNSLTAGCVADWTTIAFCAALATKEAAAKVPADLTKDEDEFYDGFTREFFSVNGDLKVSEQQRQDALALCKQAGKKAALACRPRSTEQTSGTICPK